MTKLSLQRGAILELRIKLEKNLIFIGETHGLDLRDFPLKEMLKKLKEAQIIDILIYELATNLISLGNKAAHHEISGIERLNAEKIDAKLTEQFLRQGLLFEEKTKKNPTFEELFFASEGKSHSTAESKSFAELLDEFDKETEKILGLPVKTKPKKESKPIQFERPVIKKDKEKDDEFKKLLELYGDDYFEKD